MGAGQNGKKFKIPNSIKIIENSRQTIQEMLAGLKGGKHWSKSSISSMPIKPIAGE